MGIFQKYLSLFVLLGIMIGTLAGEYLGDLSAYLSSLSYQGINIPIAILVWIMIFPMMLSIDLRKVKDIISAPGGLTLTLIANWAVKPFTMAGIAALFFYAIYSGIYTETEANALYSGAVLLGAAPCTAMVFVWSKLTKGDALYTLVQVVVNDLLILVLFVPIVGLLLGIAGIIVPYGTLLFSIVIFVLLPLLVAQIVRILPTSGKTALWARLKRTTEPATEVALVLTVALIFAYQSGGIVSNLIDLGLIAVPLLIQTYLIFGLQWIIARKISLPFKIAAPGCMIGASNFFELAVVLAIALFGIDSLAVTATIAGVLVEVPVMLSLVGFANRQAW